MKITNAVIIAGYLFYRGRLTTEIIYPLLNFPHISLVILSAAALLVAQMLALYRLVIFLRTMDLRLPSPHVFKLTMIGNFFNVVAPGMVGGDIIKGGYVFRSEEDRRGRSSGIVLMDRVMGFGA